MAVVVTGLAEVRAKMERAKRRVSDLAPFLRTERASLRSFIERSWEGRVGPDGAAWPRDKDGQSDSTGRLRAAARVVAGRTSMTISVPLGYARYQFARRNPLPVLQSGSGYSLPSSGRGRLWFEGHTRRLKRHLSGHGNGR